MLRSWHSAEQWQGLRDLLGVIDARIEVLVLSVGKRKGEEAYDVATAELAKLDD